jgi:hypothetical protein
MINGLIAQAAANRDRNVEHFPGSCQPIGIAVDHCFSGGFEVPLCRRAVSAHRSCTPPKAAARRIHACDPGLLISPRYELPCRPPREFSAEIQQHLCRRPTTPPLRAYHPSEPHERQQRATGVKEQEQRNAMRSSNGSIKMLSVSAKNAATVRDP